MTPSQKASALRDVIRESVSIPVPNSALSEATYTLSEGGRWPDDVDSVSVEQILLCWQLVEWIKGNGGVLPDDYRL